MHENCKGTIGLLSWHTSSELHGKWGVTVSEIKCIAHAGQVNVSNRFYPPFCPGCGQRLNEQATDATARPRTPWHQSFGKESLPETDPGAGPPIIAGI
jgi:hypothetical protein